MVRDARGLWLGSWLGGGLALASSSCGPSEQKDPAPLPTQTEGADDDADDGSMTVTDTADSGSGSGGDGGNCGGMNCTGHGACVEDDDGNETCLCDDGYQYDTESGECIVDEACIEVRYLEDRCRQIFDGAPAVSLFFAVDFCAGTAVLPEDIERLELEFQVLEDGIDIAENVESYSTIVDTAVESYVTLSIDVSDSVTDDDDLEALVTELRAFVQGLAPAPGEPELYVSVDVFGWRAAEYVPFTRDLAAVDAALAVLASDPAEVVAVAGNGESTSLFNAVEFGIQRTQRARDLRDAVTWGGVLTTGTVVVVTDGNDTSGATLDTGLLDKTTNQVISIGISSEIEDVDLQKIGPDGSFLAPTVTDWSEAFSEIRERVEQYPERSYLLAYCSSLTEGNPQVQVQVKFPDGSVTDAAGCDFLPDYFGVDPLDTCTPELFANECEFAECAGITACGGCEDDECCDGFGSCTSPQTATQIESSCDAQNELCYNDDQVCPATTGECQAPTAFGDPCDEDLPCEPGVGFCDPITETCTPTIGLGEPCGDLPLSCETMHCDRTDPDAPLDIKVCQPPAEVYDSCGDKFGVCEVGAYCKGSECAPRLRAVESCSEGADCRHAQCVEIESGGKICGPRPACFWAWDQKFPD